MEAFNASEKLFNMDFHATLINTRNRREERLFACHYTIALYANFTFFSLHISINNNLQMKIKCSIAIYASYVMTKAQKSFAGGC